MASSALSEKALIIAVSRAVSPCPSEAAVCLRVFFFTALAGWF
jgi:hypothetical protein